MTEDVEQVTVEFTPEGHLRLPADFARAHFPDDRIAALRAPTGEIVVMPVGVAASGGLMLKQRNVAGDRSVLLREALADDYPVGFVGAQWSRKRRRLTITEGGSR
jgi:hydrogenase maturation protease